LILSAKRLLSQALTYSSCSLRGSAREVQLVINNRISFVVRVVAGSVALSFVAVILYVVGQPLASQIASSSFTYLPFILGIAAVSIVSVLIYAFFDKARSLKKVHG
jgi:hypothetical protein